MRDAHQIIHRPHVTEKGSFQTESANQYVFEVAADANKVEIRQAVEKLFDVKVVSVHTMLRKGKAKGMGARQWTRPSVKRALVKLKAGQTIEFV